MSGTLFESSPAGQVPQIVGVGEDEFPARHVYESTRWSRRKRLTVIGSLSFTAIGAVTALVIASASGAFASAAGLCGGG